MGKEGHTGSNLSWKDLSGCIAGARMEAMRVQEMLCEAGTFNQVVGLEDGGSTGCKQVLEKGLSPAKQRFSVYRQV